MSKIVLTGDRPTGKLHLGHFVGSLQNRLELQKDSSFDDIFIMLADAQALTDNSKNPTKIRDNIIEVVLDYLSIGLDPNRVTFFIQSQIPALTELTFYYMNLVSIARLERNPTVKNEIKLRGFKEKDNEQGIPTGFVVYPISQAADITAFNANYVPVGEDQKPMLEQTREIVETFNKTYGETLVMPNIILPKSNSANRLVGIDGSEKMSKSLNNAIFLSDDEKTLHDKVFKCYTDPSHININDKGNLENNVVFKYLDVFCEEDTFTRFLPDYNNLQEMKDHYSCGGLGDVKCKKLLFDVLNDKLSKCRENREIWKNKIEDIYDILEAGTNKAIKVSNATLDKVKTAMKIDYFNDKNTLINDWKNWLNG